MIRIAGPTDEPPLPSNPTGTGWFSALLDEIYERAGGIGELMENVFEEVSAWMLADIGLRA